MRISILGTRGNIRQSAPKHARHSGILVDGRLLLDLGQVSYLDYRPQHIFITHLHSDHAVFMKEDVSPGGQHLCAGTYEEAVQRTDNLPPGPRPSL
jgi:hypothetical protein